MKIFLAAILTACCLQATLFTAEAATATPPTEERLLFAYYDATAARLGRGDAVCMNTTNLLAPLEGRQERMMREVVLRELVTHKRIVVVPTILLENSEKISKKYIAVSWFNPELEACRGKTWTYTILCRPELPVLLCQEKEVPGVIVPEGERDVRIVLSAAQIAKHAARIIAEEAKHRRGVLSEEEYDRQECALMLAQGIAEQEESMAAVASKEQQHTAEWLRLRAQHMARWAASHRSLATCELQRAVALQRAEGMLQRANGGGTRKERLVSFVDASAAPAASAPAGISIDDL